MWRQVFPVQTKGRVQKSLQCFLQAPVTSDVGVLDMSVLAPLSETTTSEEKTFFPIKTDI